MPHLSIKHFPVELGQEEINQLCLELTQLIIKYFQCKEGVISIALETIQKEAWYKMVYEPEIIQKNELLCKFPNY